MSEQFLNSVKLHCDNCLVVLPTLAENSVDSCVTDPPYHLVSIVKRFGGEDRKKWEAIGNNHGGGASPYQRTSVGFMGKQWDGGNIAQSVDLWRQVYRVLKPGAHLLAFGGTRTYHRMACAIEDAGFEIRDCIQWLYGSGFPKSHDVSKGIDLAAGAERPRTIPNKQGKPINVWKVEHGGQANHWQADAYERGENFMLKSNEPQTDAARQWEGWGTALKPANEPIVLARKPLSEKTIAANVLRWGTGAINVDGCRVETYNDLNGGRYSDNKRGDDGNTYGSGINLRSNNNYNQSSGRWPANVIHDGSDEVLAGFPETHGANNKTETPCTITKDQVYSGGWQTQIKNPDYYADNGGSAARFFYTSKADSDDRLGSKHPTVKPLDLMQYLVRLVTPKGGTVLDPFAGTGTTGEAAWREGMHSILIERELEYLADIRRRMELCLAGPDERAFKAQKARQTDKPLDYGPLFAGVA